MSSCRLVKRTSGSSASGSSCAGYAAWVFFGREHGMESFPWPLGRSVTKSNPSPDGSRRSRIWDVSFSWILSGDEGRQRASVRTRPSADRPAFEVPAPPGRLWRSRMPAPSARRLSPRGKLAADPEYHDRCRDSPRNGAFAIRITGSSIGRRTPSPLSETAKQLRDRKRRLRYLANNTSALDLKHCAG